MPVRVKQRAIGAELVREDEKQLEVLRKQIVGMLLAWHNPVTVILKSAESSKRLNIRGKGVPMISVKLEDSILRKFDVPLICSILSQAGFIQPLDWDTWIKTSARTPWITIKGAISLQPAPSKQAQFMSIGIHPITSEMGSNILYDEINRLFALSNFGNQEVVSDAENDTKAGKSKDRRFKTNGFTNRQLKGGGKGVDRWAMFYIRIDIQNTKLCFGDDVDRIGEGTLSSVIRVLEAMITRFLEENHFRPRARLGRRQQGISTKPEAIPRNPISGLSGATIHRSETAKHTYSDQNFSTWSRIRAGKGSKSSGASLSLSSTGCQGGTTKGKVSGVKDVSTTTIGTFQNADALNTAVNDLNITSTDDQMLEWRNPVSGATILVNARTGLVVPPRPLKRPVSAPSKQTPAASSSPHNSTVHLSYPNRRLTRSLSNPFEKPKEGSWSSKLLKKWENPVFDTTEQWIPQVSLSGPTVETSDVLHGRRHCCSDSDIQKAFTQASASCSAKISKQGLSTARVISQVDKKFILICVNGSSNTMDREEADLLVLVDQHAADERIRVEVLLADLKASPASLSKPLTFEIQAREHHLLSRLASSFAALGIAYDLTAPAGSSNCKLVVTALPAAIAERCRLEPKVLIELIRGEAWRCEAEGASLVSNPCPQRLLDMLNSRACRSAIMFNDALTREECQTLIHRLGTCASPFQCAHGRPSMIPLVDLGVGAELEVGKRPLASSLGGSGLDVSNEGGFGSAWRGWKPNGLG